MVRLRLALALLGGVLAFPACGEEECRDADGDGRGEGCTQGPDCDDGDPDLGESCDAEAMACVDDPFAQGCACFPSVRRECYEGPEATRDVGPCRAGRQRCPTGTWGTCEGQVLPAFESCNAEDDDCDGFVDEGALSPCGGCNPACRGGVWGPPATPFEPEGELDVTAAGELTLRSRPLESNAVFVPNSGEGTLSKVDAAEAREVGRYPVAGEAPERIAVDYQGDAWVLSPGFTDVSYLTKVAGRSERCQDRDGGGLVTSDGPRHVLPAGEDECVLLSLPIGEAGEAARAIAVDGRREPDRELGGDVWIGLGRAQRWLELDGESGEVVQRFETPGFSPYAATFDPWGTLWAIDRAGLLARIRPTTPPRVEVIEAPLVCYELEALASDAQGVLTFGGFACEDVVQYDPRRDRWEYAKTQGVLDTRAVTSLEGDSWVVHSSGRISRVQRSPLALLDTFALATDDALPFESTALGADSLGQLWIASSMGAPDGSGVLSRFDLGSERVTAQVPLGRLPRAQGDITGDRRLAEFAPEASATHVFGGCGVPRDTQESRVAPPTDWKRLHIGWAVGPTANVVVEARHAESRDALDEAEYVELGTLPDDEPPYELPFATGGVVEVRLTLRVRDRLGAPRIARVGLEWACAGPD